MLICQVVSGLMYGGGQRVALDLAEGLDGRRGSRSLIVLLGTPASGFPSIGQDLVCLDTYDGRYNRPSSLIRTAFALRRVLRDRGAAIVHSHGWDADVIAGLAVRLSTTCHVVHQHILAEWAASSRPVHRARRQVTRLALSYKRTHWIAVSSGVKASLRPLTWLKPEAVRVVWNGVDLRRFNPSRSPRVTGRVTIGVAARLVSMKGLKYLVEAVAELRGRGVECDLQIAGDGPLRAELEDLVYARSLSGMVTFRGQLGDLPAFYRSVDVFALPSIGLEGLPLSILEAMASGLPVVSTILSGIPEVVADGVSGTLVRPRDVNAMADGLEPLLRCSALRARMGAEGRRRAEQMFSMDRMVDDVSSVYGQAQSIA